MRKTGFVKAKHTNALRLMLCDKGDEGVYVFGYTSLTDGPCDWDQHCQDLEDAYELGMEYGITREDWVTIAPTQVHCQDDWIAPVRVIGRNLGKPQWGAFERWDGKKWIRLPPQR